MRVQTQREAFALRFAADENGLDFDWRGQAKFPMGRRAQLENGDHMLAYGYSGGNRWGYMLYGPRIHDETTLDDDKVYHSYSDEPGVHSELLDSFMDHPDHPWHYDDMHSAMRAAEGHYKSLNRRGAAPSSGVDYSDLNKFMEGL